VKQKSVLESQRQDLAKPGKADETDYFHESQKMSHYKRLSLELLLAHPEVLIRKTRGRFIKFWTKTPRKGKHYQPIKTIEDFAVGISYVFILTMGIAGLCLGLMKGSNVLLPALAILTLPVPYYLTIFTRFRYRYPVEPILIIFASYAIYRLLKLVKVNNPLTGSEWQ
jgi:hypothetical protein